MTYDVIVIGGGVAGLEAAQRLGRAKKRVLVVEARERLGGRLWTRHAGGLPPVELGAEFVHGRPQNLLRRLRAAGARLGNADGAHLIAARGKLVAAGPEFEQVMRVFGTPRPRDESMRRVIERELTGNARDLARAYVEGMYAADVRRASAQAIMRMTDADEDYGLHRVLDGYDRLTGHFARDLDRRGVATRLGICIERVRWRAGQVEVAGRSLVGEPFTAMAKRVVVTVPLAVVDRIHFLPELREKRRLWRALETGNVVKVILRFSPNVPWARKSFTFLHGAALRVPTFWRLAPFPQQTLVGWAAGPKADALGRLSDANIVGTALASLGKMLRCRADAELDAAEVVNWGRDPLARGAYCVVPVGATAAQDQLALPVERTLFFAGEATDVKNAGTIHGAMASGARAAAEITSFPLGPPASNLIGHG
jgi:monoamine oxidase